MLQSRLNCSADELAQYVLNLQSPWQVEKKEEDTWGQLLEVALNELDTAILGIVDTLEMPTGKVADYLDSCLQSSYWQRRLQRETPQVRSLQEAVIRGRARWIWTNTTANKRRAFFAASIGFKTGTAIEERLQELGELLRNAEDAIRTGNLEDAVHSTVTVAEILFTVGPFLPDDPIEN